MEPIRPEITLKDVLFSVITLIKYLFSKWAIITLVSLLSGVIGLLVALNDKYDYKASLSFVVEDDKAASGLSGALGLASQFGVDIGGGGNANAFSGSNLLELMKSRFLIQKSLLIPLQYKNKKTTLADIFIEMNNWGEKNQKKGIKKINYSSIRGNSFSIEQDSLLSAIHTKILKDNLKIGLRDKKGSIIDVTVVSGNEFFSKYFVEHLVNVVSVFYIETKTKKTFANVQILEKQTDSVRRQLNLAIGGVAQSFDATFNLNPSMTISRLPSRRREIDVQANTAILTELVKNLELARISLRKETPLIQVIDIPILPLEKKKLGKTKGVIIGFVLGFAVIVALLTGIRAIKNSI